MLAALVRRAGLLQDPALASLRGVMAERHRWTIMWVPHGAGTTRSIGVSYRALKFIGGTAAVVLVVGLVFAYTEIGRAHV